MKKKLGQNFLTDKNVALKEIQYANVKKNDVVLEIGPGKGVLTKILSEKAKKVIAIELDKRLFEELQKNMPDNVVLINNDVLDIDFNTLPRFNKIVSNLPFQISSPVTFKILDYDFDLAVLIYQKEFADRMVAESGYKDYSRLSVGVYYKTFCEILEIVPKTCFRPQPKVDSCIVKLIPREFPAFFVEDETFFLNFVKDLFSQRRKKIKNTLQSFYGFKNADINYSDKRVEELDPEQIGELSNIVYSRIKK